MKKQRIGIVNVSSGITPKGEEYWQLEYRCPESYPGDPDKGTRMRRRFRKDEMSWEQVCKMAENLTAQAYQGKGYLTRKITSPVAPVIDKGIISALNLTNTLKEVKSERARLADKFTEWLSTNHPDVRTWDQMRPSIIQAYVLELERKGKAYDTVRLAVAPIKLAWRHMAEDYPGLVPPVPKIRQAPKPRSELETPEPALVRELLDWLKENRPDLWPIATLQALAGLRMMEAVSIRRQDVDFKAGTVRITNTEKHRLKTIGSERTLPIPDEALTALRAAKDAQVVIPPTNELFVNERGNLWKKDALVNKWRRIQSTIKMMRGKVALESKGVTVPTLDAVPVLAKKHKVDLKARPFQAHRLRAFFATTASRLGVPDRLVKAYMGHAAQDVLGEHYLKIGLDDMKAVAEAMNGWRRNNETRAKVGDIDQKAG